MITVAIIISLIFFLGWFATSFMADVFGFENDFVDGMGCILFMLIVVGIVRFLFLLWASWHRPMTVFENTKQPEAGDMVVALIILSILFLVALVSTAGHDGYKEVNWYDNEHAERARILTEKGHIDFPEDYFTVFPEACRKCGGREFEETITSVDVFEDITYVYHTVRSRRECCRCGEGVLLKDHREAYAHPTEGKKFKYTVRPYRDFETWPGVSELPDIVPSYQQRDIKAG